MPISKTVIKEITSLPDHDLEEIGKLINSIVSSRKESRSRKAKRIIAQSLRVGDIIDKNIKCLHPAKVINRSGNSVTIKWKEPLELPQTELDKRKAKKQSMMEECVETFSLDKITVMNAWRNGKKYFDIHEI